jgi:hypothetical protein
VYVGVSKDRSLLPVRANGIKSANLCLLILALVFVPGGFLDLGSCEFPFRTSGPRSGKKMVSLHFCRHQAGTDFHVASYATISCPRYGDNEWVASEEKP